MNDEHLDRLLERAGPAYRPPPAPDLDALWRGIDARRRPTRASTSHTPAWWTLRVAGIAAALAIAFALGRTTASDQAARDQVAAESGSLNLPVDQPVSAITTELLGQTVVLLAALPEERSDTVPDRQFTRQAGALLSNDPRAPRLTRRGKRSEASQPARGPRAGAGADRPAPAGRAVEDRARAHYRSAAAAGSGAAHPQHCRRPQCRR